MVETELDLGQVWKYRGNTYSWVETELDVGLVWKHRGNIYCWVETEVDLSQVWNHHHGGPSVSRMTLSVPLICGYGSGSSGRSWTCRAVRMWAWCGSIEVISTAG